MAVGRPAPAGPAAYRAGRPDEAEARLGRALAATGEDPAVLFPRARIVHCRRDARDTCWSCYRQNFVAAHRWSTDLADLGRYWCGYRRLMDHWKEVLPVPVFEVDYETLVGDREAVTRSLVEFLRLAWDPACLTPQRTAGVVRTASGWQVRRPVSATSVGRWRAYAPWLGALSDRLASSPQISFLDVVNPRVIQGIRP